MPRKTSGSRWNTKEENFWLKVERVDSGCWLWRGCINAYGYGVFGKPRPQRGTMLAHRFAYQHFVAAIPDGLTIDHLCRVRNCVNPEHLEPVPYSVNRQREVERRTHCKNGHEMTPENTAFRKDRPNARECIACRLVHRPHSTRVRGRAKDGTFVWSEA